MKQITTSNEQILRHLSQMQKETSQAVLQSQKNLLATSVLLKKYHPNERERKEMDKPRPKQDQDMS